jgi:rare lipoprotein A (peptidoglycan hydrolase)
MKFQIFTSVVQSFVPKLVFGVLLKQYNLRNAENFRKNFNLQATNGHQKLDIIFKNTSWDLFYELQKIEKYNRRAGNAKSKSTGNPFHLLEQKKITMNGELSLYQNKFIGKRTSVGFQMLEGPKLDKT